MEEDQNEAEEEKVELQCQELLNMSIEDYVKFKKDIVSRKWGENEGKSAAHEYLKGQFIILREILEPTYRRINP